MSVDIMQAAQEHNRVVSDFFTRYADDLNALAAHIAAQISAGHTLLVCGNGGSACDAMHIAGEFVGRFKRERRGLPAIALSADSGIITAVGNDYGFERIFARQLEALGNAGDVLISMSTSGSSPNIVAALKEAEASDIHRVLFTGQKGADKASMVERCFVIDSTDTAHIQECTMVALHLLAHAVETIISSPHDKE